MQTGRPCSVQQRGARPRLAAEARRPLDDVKRVSQLSSKWIEAKSRGDKCVTQAEVRGCGGAVAGAGAVRGRTRRRAPRGRRPGGRAPAGRARAARGARLCCI